MIHTAKDGYRGVVCAACRQPIPLPALLQDRDFSEESESAPRVFSLRCRACEKEKPYSANSVVEFEGMPRGRNRAHVAPTRPMKPLTKAATA